MVKPLRSSSLKLYSMLYRRRRASARERLKIASKGLWLVCTVMSPLPKSNWSNSLKAWTIVRVSFSINFMRISVLWALSRELKLWATVCLVTLDSILPVLFNPRVDGPAQFPLFFSPAFIYRLGIFITARVMFWCPFYCQPTSAINSKGLKQYAQPLPIGITFIGIKHYYNDVPDRMAW